MTKTTKQLEKDAAPRTRLVGRDVRALRKARGLTLQQLSVAIDRSVGWISQVERDLSRPDMDDLRSIADVFEVPLSIFFGTADAPELERGRIVRKDARRVIGAHETGLLEALVSPDLTDDFEVVHSTFLPGSGLTTPISRPTTEVAYVISGTLDLWIEEKTFTIQTGDSFRLRGELHRWSNPYDTPAEALWVISPPVY